MKTNLKLTTISLAPQPLTSAKLTIAVVKKTTNVNFAGPVPRPLVIRSWEGMIAPIPWTRDVKQWHVPNVPLPPQLAPHVTPHFSPHTIKLTSKVARSRRLPTPSPLKPFALATLRHTQFILYTFEKSPPNMSNDRIPRLLDLLPRHRHTSCLSREFRPVPRLASVGGLQTPRAASFLSFSIVGACYENS
jgi:hypothetical protein